MSQQSQSLKLISIFISCLLAYFLLPYFLPWRETWVYEILFFLTPSLLVYAFIIKEKPPFQKIAVKKIALISLATVIISLLLQVITYYWSQWLPPPQELQQYYEKILKPPTLWEKSLLYITSGLIPAISEELLFRGVLFAALIHYTPNRIIIIISAGLFALSHLNPSYVGLYFILGVYLSWIQIKTRNIGMTIGAHLINNIIALLATIFF